MLRQGNDRTSKRKITVRCPDCRIERRDSAIRNPMAWLERVAAENWNQRVEVHPPSGLMTDEESRLDRDLQADGETEGGES